MYTLVSEHSFDAAHFLHGYNGKCSNIHGHRWRVVVEIYSESLKTDDHTRGMVVDFDELKDTVKNAVDIFDHSLIIEKDTLMPKTLEALTEEGIRMIELEFRTTAENFAKYVRTKLFRFLVLQSVTSISLSKEKFCFVPMLDFSTSWTDENLYTEFDLSQEEINFVESMIKEKVGNE